MRHATLSAPPRFGVLERARGRVTLASDTGAVAHVFVLENDVLRLLLLPRGVIEGPPSWAVAPGATHIAQPRPGRMSLDGLGCPGLTL